MTQAIATKKPPYLLMYIVTLVYLVVTAFFEEGVAYFDPVYTTLMSSTEFYLTFSLCAVLFLTVIYIAKHYFGIRINWVFFSLVVLLFLIDVVAILSFPEWTVLTGVYHVTVSLRLRYITFWLAACMAFYVFFAIMPKSVNNVKAWGVYYLLAIIIVLSAIIYSYITESSKYVSFFSGEMDKFKIYIVSYTNNRNTYGTLLIVGIASSILAFQYSRKIICFFTSFFFYVNSLFVGGRSSLICATFLLLGFIVFDLIRNIKRRPFLNSLFLFLILACCLSIFFLPNVIGQPNNFLGTISKYFSTLFNFSDFRFSETISTRTSIWEDIISILFSNSFRAFFGVGDWNFSWLLGFHVSGSSSYIESAHSGFFDVMGRFGVLGLCFYLAMISYFIYVCYKNLKSNHIETVTSLLLFFCVLFHGLSEDTNFLNMQSKDMMFLFLVFMPVITTHQLDAKTANTAGWEFEYSSSCNHKFGECPKREIAFSLVFCVLEPLTAVVIGLSRFFSVWNELHFVDSVFFQLQFILLILFLPIIVYSSFFYKENHHNQKFSIYLSFGIVWALLCVIFSLFIQTAILFSVLLVTGSLLTCLSFFGIDKASMKRLLTSSAVFLIIEIVLVLISKITVKYCLVADVAYQPYAVMCLILLDLFVPFLVVIGCPLHKNLILPVDEEWLRIEYAYLFIGYRYQARYEIRLMRVSQRKPILRNQK
jgi:hypothetical protein